MNTPPKEQRENGEVNQSHQQGAGIDVPYRPVDDRVGNEQGGQKGNLHQTAEKIPGTRHRRLPEGKLVDHLNGPRDGDRAGEGQDQANEVMAGEVNIPAMIRAPCRLRPRCWAMLSSTRVLANALNRRISGNTDRSSVAPNSRMRFPKSRDPRFLNRSASADPSYRLRHYSLDGGIRPSQRVRTLQEFLTCPFAESADPYARSWNRGRSILRRRQRI
jgi:hypothetical protein